MSANSIFVPKVCSQESLFTVPLIECSHYPLSPGGMVRKQLPRGPLDTLSIYWCRKRFWGVSNLRRVRGLFEKLENFYPLKGLCKADTEGGPIVFTYVLFCVRKRILEFQFTDGFLPF